MIKNAHQQIIIGGSRSFLKTPKPEKQAARPCKKGEEQQVLSANDLSRRGFNRFVLENNKNRRKSACIKVQRARSVALHS